jgi:Leucine-rich repeat (LRR) protein
MYSQENPCEGKKVYFSLEKALEVPLEVLVLDMALSELKITAVPEEIGQLENLECLDVSFNRVASILESIVNCWNLKSINLSGNRYSKNINAS